AAAGMGVASFHHRGAGGPGPERGVTFRRAGGGEPRPPRSFHAPCRCVTVICLADYLPDLCSCHHSAAWTRDSRCSFASAWERWDFTVVTSTTRARAIC